MSNHSGSYMLNDAIEILNRYQVFSAMEKATLQIMIKEIVEMASMDYGCIPGEILDGYAHQFSLCYCCLSQTNDLEGQLCTKCRRN
jgi:hypothetical protein